MTSPTGTTTDDDTDTGTDTGVDTGVDPQRAALARHVRYVWCIGMVAGGLCVFGHIMDTRMGGFGPSLFWLGLIAASFAFGFGTLLQFVIHPLLHDHPDYTLSLYPVFSAGKTILFVGSVTLVLFELVSRETHPVSKRTWETAELATGPHEPDALLGWAPAKNYHGKIELQSGELTIQVNSHGFLDIEQDNDPTRPHVVITGDSYAVGWGDGYAESITPRLRADIPEAQVFNVGWAGWSKDQIALSYRSRAKPLRPKVVVVMCLVNPARDDSLPLYGGLRKPWFVLEAGALVMKGLPLVFHNTPEDNRDLYRRFEADRITGPGTALRFLTYTFPRDYLSLGRRFFPDYDWDVVNEHGLPPLSRLESAILADLKRQVETDGARMVIALAPLPLIFAGCKDPARAMRSYVDSYRKIGLDPLDITPFITSDWSQFYNEEAHPNARGLELIRAELTRRVKKALVD